MNHHVSLGLAFWIGLCVTLVPWSLAIADTIYLKDGTILNGRVVKEQESISDPLTGEFIQVSKTNGFYAIDDGARAYIFSHKQVQDVEKKPYGTEFEAFVRPVYTSGRNRLPVGVRFLDVNDFDNQWKRTLRVQNEAGIFRITQAVHIINPLFVKLESTNYFWATYFLVPEFGPDVVRRLIVTHPDMVEKPGEVNVDKRMRLYRYFVQANWLASAEAELNKLAKEAPNAKERVEDARKRLRTLQLSSLFDEIEIARNAGRHRAAQQLLSLMPAEGLDEVLTRKVNGLRDRYRTSTEQLTNARRLLGEVGEQVPNVKEIFGDEVISAIDNELNLDNVSRLDAFVTLAEQAEADRKRGRGATHTPPQLLALAVSGWLLGKNAAETKIDTARKLWLGRKFLLDYLRSESATARSRYLADAEKYAFGVDELAQITAHLPPPLAETTAPQEAVDRVAPPAPRSSRQIKFRLKLPPEYSPGRNYPVLIALGQPAEKIQSIAERMAPWTDRYGYILAIPDWHDGLSEQYQFTYNEQAAVLATLLELRRRYQVDSDRVYVFGLGEGGSLALDVGLSHPDLFAGIIPMGSLPRWSKDMFYWRNGQNLAFYFVGGSQAGDSPAQTRRLFEQWMPKGYNAIYAVHKGRAMEWLGTELPPIFEWMPRQKRQFPIADLGSNPVGGSEGLEYQSLRTTDDRFYWLSSKDIIEGGLLDGKRTIREYRPARFQGSIRGNDIHVFTFGLRQVSIWLTRAMIDFENPVTLRVNRKDYPLANKGKLKPSILVMLEDLAERHDRQRLFWARLDVTP